MLVFALGLYNLRAFFILKFLCVRTFLPFPKKLKRNVMTDHDYMRRAIDLAKRARGFTNPNPMVGAVIVKNGVIIGEGYHKRCGELHAERNAFASLENASDAEGATIYVTLEPCCHYGKTPPCTEAIIEHKIKRVVIGSRDPNPLVSGKGAALLREHGIEVCEDFLREECDAINHIFFHYITTKRPFVTVKYAMTMDGKIATKTGASKWITGDEARGEVQKMRHNHMAIMAGIGTVLADDPMLNVRVDGLKSPIRVICDSKLKIPLESQIVNSANTYRTIVVCASEDKEKIDALNAKQVEVVCLPNDEGKVDLVKLIEYLGAQQIDSVFVEGGAILNDSLFRLGLVNRVESFVAPKVFGGAMAKSPVEGEGISLVDEAKLFSLSEIKQIGEDVLLSYERQVD